MMEVGRSSVQAWECDVVGHLNSQFYIERVGEAAAVLLSGLGCGPRALVARGLRLTVLDQHMRFLSELRVWRSYAVRAGVVSADRRGLTIYCEIVEDVTGRVSAAITTNYGVHALATEHRDEMPDEIVDGAPALTVSVPPHGLPRGIAIAEPVDMEHANPVVLASMRMTATGLVKPSECDEHGRLLPRYFTGHFINGVTALQQPERREAGMLDVPGGAAVENRIVYRRYPRAGDAIKIHSAITTVSERSYNWVHWMSDAESGALIASNEAVAICMDLEARKAIPLPEAFHRDLLSRVNGAVRL